MFFVRGENMRTDFTINNKIFFWGFTIVFIILANLCLIFAQEGKENKSELNIENCEKCCKVCRENYALSCPSAPTIFKKFGVVNHETEMANLDGYTNNIQANPDTDYYIVVYGGRLNKYGEFDERVKRIKSYLFNYRKLDPSQFKIIHGGFRENFEFELWLSPLKDSFPPLSPTIDPEKVQFKGKMKPLITEI